jgi:predicted nuclease of predicted toxin-antitoxin system
MKIRFQADADLNQIILLATVRQEPAVDFQTAIAAGLANVEDPEVLVRAAKNGRVLVTHDRKTMPRHFSDFISREPSPGLIVIPQSLSVVTAAEDLILIWSATEAEEWINRMGVLPL